MLICVGPCGLGGVLRVGHARPNLKLGSLVHRPYHGDATEQRSSEGEGAAAMHSAEETELIDKGVPEDDHVGCGDEDRAAKIDPYGARLAVGVGWQSRWGARAVKEPGEMGMRPQPQQEVLWAGRQRQTTSSLNCNRLA
jgi:hypothetical protein